MLGWGGNGGASASTASTFWPRAAFCRSAPEPAPGPIVVRSIAPGTCPGCGSRNSKRGGVRRNKLRRSQKHRCRDCGAYFSEGTGLIRTKLPSGTMADAMQMSMSYPATASSLAMNGLKVCAKTVCSIVRRCSGTLIEYCDLPQPAVSELWRTGEKLVGVIGGGTYLHGMMDDATRLILSVQLAARKAKDDVSLMYEAGAAWAGKIPHLPVSDGAPSFRVA